MASENEHVEIDHIHYEEVVMDCAGVRYAEQTHGDDWYRRLVRLGGRVVKDYGEEYWLKVNAAVGSEEEMAALIANSHEEAALQVEAALV